ncbi:MAG: SurA N-terminal domain-containing protein [Puniceicoccaceae bacterium]
MITSLQNFFLKHNKWLFGGLLIVIIVTFVLTIGPQSFFGSGTGGQRQSLNYYGYDLTSESDQRSMSFTAEISAILHPELRLRREQLMDYAYMRVAGLGMANQLGIPQPSKEELAAYVETLLIFADPATGEFSAESYNRMMDSLQSSARYNREAIGTVLREDYRIAEVRKALGGPDYSLPHEVRQDYLDQQTTYEIAIARLDFDSFEPEIDSTDEALLQFFNENPARYEVEETLLVDALLFRASAYLEEVADPVEGVLEAFFATNSARYQPAPVEGEEAVEVTLADVRDQALADWKLSEARGVAARKGEAFSLKLWQDSVVLDSEAYGSMVEEFSVEVRELPPYSRTSSPSVQDIPADLLNSMWIFASNPNRYFSDIGQIADGAVVLVKRGLTEARMPEFEEVRDLVARDFAASEKRRLFSEKGSELYTEISARLGSEPFSGIAESLGLTVESMEPFSGSQPPRELLASTLWDQARFLEEDRVTRMVINGNQGSFACVTSKEVPQVDASDEEFIAFVAQRTNVLGGAMGWARLREITDNSLNQLIGPRESE